MRLSLVLTNIELEKPAPPTRCPYDDCQSTQLRLHQEVVKPLRDTRYQQVTAYRYQCLTCKRTFRVYPSGVNSAPTSQRVKDLGVILYMLGLSYRSVSHSLEALGIYLCASCIYSAVQATLREHPEIARQTLLQGVKTPGGSAGAAHVKFHGKWLPMSLVLGHNGDMREATLAFDELTEEDALELATSISPLAQVSVEQLPTASETTANERMTDDGALLKDERDAEPSVTDLSTAPAMAGS
jgi:hypothetical protein